MHKLFGFLLIVGFAALLAAIGYCGTWGTVTP